MSDNMERLDRILDCIDSIDFILKNNSIKITSAIENTLIKPAIRMHIIRIAEEFNRLKEDNEFEILSNFENKDLKGLSAVRNYIAHDYDSTDDIIIENVIRDRLPKIKEVIESIKKN